MSEMTREAREIFDRVDKYRATGGNLATITITPNEYETLRQALTARSEGFREGVQMIPVAAWVYAYTSLGCDLESAEKMVRAEIAKWFDEANYRVSHPALKPICDLVSRALTPPSPNDGGERG